MTDEDTLRGLRTKLTDCSFKIRRFDAYYDGALRLEALGLSLPPEMRQLQTVVNWPRLTVDALEERINLQGFRLAGAEATDDRLWSWWQANDLDEEAPLAHLESFIQGIGYISVGYDEDRPDVPIITPESARNMAVDVDPRTRKVKSAARFYDHNVAAEPQSATLYLPDRTIFFVADRGRWRVSDTIDGVGQVPVVPMANRARLADRGGRSEMVDVIGLTDAACRALTNLQGAQELMALPTRYVFGIDENNMKTQDGAAVTKWEAYMGRFNALTSKDAKVEQLPAADLRNFTEVLNQYARMVSSVTGMPPHFMGLSSDNPASADAIRSAEARHVKRAERKIKTFGGAWEQVMRLAMLMVDGEVPDEAERMEAVFDDPATPTFAARVDAVVKLYGNGSGLLPRQAAWEDLGYSPERIRRLTALSETDATSKLLASLFVPDDAATATLRATGATAPAQAVSAALPNVPPA